MVVESCTTHLNTSGSLPGHFLIYLAIFTYLPGHFFLSTWPFFVSTWPHPPRIRPQLPQHTVHRRRFRHYNTVPGPAGHSSTTTYSTWTCRIHLPSTLQLLLALLPNISPIAHCIVWLNQVSINILQRGVCMWWSNVAKELDLFIDPWVLWTQFNIVRERFSKKKN